MRTARFREYVGAGQRAFDLVGRSGRPPVEAFRKLLHVLTRWRLVCSLHEVRNPK
jgi:hypothetical protein